MTVPYYSPFPGVPHRNRRKKRIIFVLAVMGGALVLCCLGGVAFALTTDTSKKPAAEATRQPDRQTDRQTDGQTGEPAATYTQPSDRCALADPKTLGPRIGDGKGEPVEENGPPPLHGCDYFLAAADGAQEMKAFADADAQSAERYRASAAVDLTQTGWKQEKAPGCGDQGVYASRLSYGDKRIESFLYCLSGNLYIEVRFTAGGTAPWDGAAMRTNMVTLAQGMISKTPKA